jgi:DmsE family decaheme c-type cytochrome
MITLFRLPAKPSNRQTPPPARRLRAARLAVLLAASVMIAAWGAQDQQGAPAQPAAPQANKPAEYVGSDTCGGCHEDIYNAFQKSPHEVVGTDKKRGWEGNACESCHGPGSKHAESMSAADIVNPAKLSPAAADQDCMKCHLNQPTHIGRINSSHAKNQVACVACHSIHKNGPYGLVPRNNADTNQLCAKCHNNVWASFQRPYKHPLPQGAMSCVDCHNPHGTVLPWSIQTVYANEPGCFKCHGEKRGPFVYEHPPMRLEGCGACHMPHGSQNPRMLTRAQVRFVCLECHANLPGPTMPANGTLGTVPPAFHDLRSPQFQNCTLCHQMVHGSYVNRDFFK